MSPASTVLATTVKESNITVLSVELISPNITGTMSPTSTGISIASKTHLGSVLETIQSNVTKKMSPASTNISNANETVLSKSPVGTNATHSRVSLVEMFSSNTTRKMSPTTTAFAMAIGTSPTVSTSNTTQMSPASIVLVMFNATHLTLAAVETASLNLTGKMSSTSAAIDSTNTTHFTLSTNETTFVNIKGRKSQQSTSPVEKSSLNKSEGMSPAWTVLTMTVNKTYATASPAEIPLLKITGTMSPILTGISVTSKSNLAKSPLETLPSNITKESIPASAVDSIGNETHFTVSSVDITSLNSTQRMSSTSIVTAKTNTTRLTVSPLESSATNTTRKMSPATTVFAIPIDTSTTVSQMVTPPSDDTQMSPTSAFIALTNTTQLKVVPLETASLNITETTSSVSPAIAISNKTQLTLLRTEVSTSNLTKTMAKANKTKPTELPVDITQIMSPTLTVFVNSSHPYLAVSPVETTLSSITQKIVSTMKIQSNITQKLTSTVFSGANKTYLSASSLKTFPANLSANETRYSIAPVETLESEKTQMVNPTMQTENSALHLTNQTVFGKANSTFVNRIIYTKVTTFVMSPGAKLAPNVTQTMSQTLNFDTTADKTLTFSSVEKTSVVTIKPKKLLTSTIFSSKVGKESINNSSKTLAPNITSKISVTQTLHAETNSTVSIEFISNFTRTTTSLLKQSSFNITDKTKQPSFLHAKPESTVVDNITVKKVISSEIMVPKVHKSGLTSLTKFLQTNLHSTSVKETASINTTYLKAPQTRTSLSGVIKQSSTKIESFLFLDLQTTSNNSFDVIGATKSASTSNSAMLIVGSSTSTQFVARRSVLTTTAAFKTSFAAVAALYTFSSFISEDISPVTTTVTELISTKYSTKLLNSITEDMQFNSSVSAGVNGTIIKVPIAINQTSSIALSRALANITISNQESVVSSVYVGLNKTHISQSILMNETRSSKEKTPVSNGTRYSYITTISSLPSYFIRKPLTTLLLRSTIAINMSRLASYKTTTVTYQSKTIANASLHETSFKEQIVSNGTTTTRSSAVLINASLTETKISFIFSSNLPNISYNASIVRSSAKFTTQGLNAYTLGAKRSVPSITPTKASRVAKSKFSVSRNNLLESDRSTTNLVLQAAEDRITSKSTLTDEVMPPTRASFVYSGTMVTATKNFHTPSKIRPSSQVFLLTTPEKTMVTPFPAYTLAAGTYECNTIDIFLF